MKAMKLLATMLGLCITLPIWYWLVYQILLRVNASELMWFLYWVYVPVGIFVSVLTKLTESAK
jgi:hypothetical protein